MNLQEKWNAAAKEKAQTNALARDLHRVFTEVDRKAPPSPGVGVTPEAVPLVNCNFKVAWLGLTFTANRLIGSGTYGQVYVVEGQGCQFAAKILKRPHDGDDVHGLCDLRDIVREANIHVRSASAFVVPCVGLGRQVDEESSPACLLMEVCEGGSLWNALQGNAATISFKQRLAWSVQIAAGLCHLHAQKVIHLDLKLDNILLASNPSHPYSRAMINDFGLAKIMGMNDEVTVTVNQAYAARYRPPECTMLIQETEAWSCLCFVARLPAPCQIIACVCVSWSCYNHVGVFLARLLYFNLFLAWLRFPRMPPAVQKRSSPRQLTYGLMDAACFVCLWRSIWSVMWRRTRNYAVSLCPRFWPALSPQSSHVA